MMVLEQDHRRLNRFVENKSAVDAELADYHENERLEDSFVISGLEPLPSSLTGKEWQTQAVQSVQAVIRELLGQELEIIVVQNVTPRQKDSEVIYNVKMCSVEASRSIRRKFGTFFHGGKDGRPSAFKSISIKNRVTADTKIRISLLKLMAKRYRDSNAGSKAQVIGYDPRPLLKITPPSGSSDRKVKVYNYVEACRSFPTTFAVADLDPILRRINPKLKGQVKSTFIVISDDQARAQAQARRGAGSGANRAPVVEDGNIEVDEDTESSSVSGSNIEPLADRRGTRRRASSPPLESTSAAKR
jgi:hypothetical protein